MHNFSKGLALASGIFAAGTSSANILNDFVDPLDGKLDASQFIMNHAYGFLPVPIIINEPAVDKGLGMIGVFFHEDEEEVEARRKAMMESDNAAARLLPPNISAVGGLFTGNGSWGVGAGHMSFFGPGDYIYRIGGGYGEFYLDVHSFANPINGSSIHLNNPVETKSEAWMFRQEGLMRLGDDGFYIGLINQGSDSKITISHGGGNVGELERPGLEQETFIMAAGPILRYDSRDNIFSSDEGLYANFFYLMYDDILGSDKDMTSALAEARYYKQFNDTFGGAVRLLSEDFDTDEKIYPFYLRPGVRMRGIPAVTYQGNTTFQSEVEGRVHLNSRWMLTSFYGYAKAAESFHDMGETSSIIGYGGGFRYMLARLFGVRAGLDFAYNKEEGVTTYIQVGSAWH